MVTAEPERYFCHFCKTELAKNELIPIPSQELEFLETKKHGLENEIERLQTFIRDLKVLQSNETRLYDYLKKEIDDYAYKLKSYSSLEDIVIDLKEGTYRHEYFCLIKTSKRKHACKLCKQSFGPKEAIVMVNSTTSYHKACFESNLYTGRFVVLFRDFKLPGELETKNLNRFFASLKIDPSEFI